MGRAPKFCADSTCGNKVVGRSYCDEHQRTPWSGGLNAWQGHGTTSAQRRLVAQVLTEEPWCQRCHAAPSTQGGHIVPRSQGGQYVRENLIGICRPCNLAMISEDRVRWRDRS